jgi:hypothetical protein
MRVKAPPDTHDASGELEALIEEARRRARRRRLGYLAVATAAALVAGGLYLVIGGGGGDGVSGQSGSGEPAAPAGSSGSSSGTAEYRCPTSIKALEAAKPGGGIPGCRVHFSATLPAGWDEGPSRLSIFPPELPGLPATDVRFANFPLRHDHGLGQWPISQMPPDGISIGIFPVEPVSPAEAAAAPEVSLEPSDFHHPVGHKFGDPRARTDLYLGRRRYEVQLRIEAVRVRPDLVDEANSLLNSIETTERLCPCGRR